MSGTGAGGVGPRDTGLALAARAAGVARATAVAAWWWLTDAAGPDGSVAHVDPEAAAFDLEVEPAVVRALLAAFADRGMIVDGRIAGWPAPRARRPDPTAAARKRAERARRRQAADGEAAVTDGHDTSRDVTTCHDVSRSVTVRDMRDPPPPLGPPPKPPGPPNTPPCNPPQPPPRAAVAKATEVGMRCLDLCGWAGDPTKTWAPVHQWLADGCDPERDVYPTIERIVASGRQPGSLAYFTKAVTEARLARTAAGDGGGDPAGTAATWRARVKGWIEHRVWPFDAGPTPDDPRCRVPADVLAAFADRLGAGRAA